MYLKQLSREAYCSAPPLQSSDIRPPRLSRDCEARRHRAPFDAPFLEIKAEVSSIESVEVDVGSFDELEDVKPEAQIRLNPLVLYFVLGLLISSKGLPLSSKGLPLFSKGHHILDTIQRPLRG